jgi:hypothetical protein
MAFLLYSGRHPRTKATRKGPCTPPSRCVSNCRNTVASRRAGLRSAPPLESILVKLVRMVETGGKGRILANRTYRQSGFAPTFSRANRLGCGQNLRLKLVEGYFELRSLGPRTVGGLLEPLNVYEVTGCGSLGSHLELAARRADEVRWERSRACANQARTRTGDRRTWADRRYDGGSRRPQSRLFRDVQGEDIGNLQRTRGLFGLAW